MDWGNLTSCMQFRASEHRFLDKLMAFFIHHRKCRRIVDCDRCSALYFKKIPPWRHADAFGRAFELYSG